MTACPEKSTLEIVQPWVTSGLVILGWWIVHLASVQRARRQEEASLVAEIEVSVTAVRDLAEGYFTGAPADAERRVEAARLKLLLRSLVMRVHLLGKRKPGHYDLDSELIAFRNAITGGDFDSKRPERLHDDPVVQRIWRSADILSEALQLALEEANAPTFSRRRLLCSKRS